MSPPESCHGLSSLLQAPKHSLELRRRCISRAASALHFAIVESIPAKPSFSGRASAAPDPAPARQSIFYFYIIALVWVAHQTDAVRLAPAGERAVVDLALALQKQLVIQPCIVVFPAVKQGSEVGGVAARTAENLGKAVRPREHTADIAPQNTRLIGEKADDRSSEILFQLPIVGFVGQFNKAADGCRVQNISGFGAFASPSSSPQCSPRIVPPLLRTTSAPLSVCASSSSPAKRSGSA